MRAPAAPLLLLTRPPAECRAAARVLQDRGIEVLCMPLQYTRRAARSPALTADLAWAAQADIQILVSRAAVAATQALAPTALAGASLRIAVGRATAQALQQLGLATLCAASKAEDSEGVLDLLPMRAVAGKRIALMAAPGGREHLFEELTRRGAQVRAIFVYRRIALAPRAGMIAALRAQASRVVLSATSVGLLTRLCSVLCAHGLESLRQRPIIVASGRIAASAQTLGFRAPMIAGGASAGAFAEELLRIARAPAGG